MEPHARRSSASSNNGATPTTRHARNISSCANVPRGGSQAPGWAAALRAPPRLPGRPSGRGRTWWNEQRARVRDKRGGGCGAGKGGGGGGAGAAGRGRGGSKGAGSATHAPRHQRRRRSVAETAAVAAEGPFGRRGTRYHPRGLRSEQRVATMREGVWGVRRGGGGRRGGAAAANESEEGAVRALGVRRRAAQGCLGAAPLGVLAHWRHRLSGGAGCAAHLPPLTVQSAAPHTRQPMGAMPVVFFLLAARQRPPTGAGPDLRSGA